MRVLSVDPHMENRGNDQWLIKNQRSYKTLLQNCGTVCSTSIISLCLFLAQISPVSCIITCPKGAHVHLSLDIMPTLNYTQTTLY